MDSNHTLMSDTSSSIFDGSVPDLPYHPPITSKIRCKYCGQKQWAGNDKCENCGAPLPDVPNVGVLVP